jgi:DNA-binding SARP family transcriptional activator
VGDEVEFGLLGPLEVRAGGEVLAIGRPKQRALLAILLLHANRVVTREHLIDELWGEEPPETAVKALQTYISQLRKLLPAETLLTRPRGYVLEVGAEAVDLLRFERLVTEARAAVPDRAAQQLREALALWRGPALAEFADEPFARAEAARLEDLRLTALEARIEADLALGCHAELVGELELLIAERPTRERLRAQLMLALYRSGRQAEALETYQDARAALGELGLEPGPALKLLERQILAQDTALELARETPAVRAALPGALMPAPPFPFVGRASELAVLRALVERARGGEGAVVLLAGEAGSGKTRLVRELAHDAAGSGMLVLYGAADAAVSTPYEPPRAWLDFLLHVSDPTTLAEHLGDPQELLARLLPELGDAPLPQPGELEADRFALQSALIEVLRRVSRVQPVLLVADDLHWADVETLHLLRRLARVAPESRLLVLAVYRDRGEERSPAFADTLADLSRLDGATRIVLGNLGGEDVGEFIHGAAGAAPDPGLAATIAELTEGTPLLLCELWRDLLERGAVQVSDGGVRLTRAPAELRGPEQVRELVEHRLSRLAPETAAMLEQAAVLGPRFQVRVLAAATEARGLDEAARSGFLEELAEPDPSYRFTHELVRRAVYDRIPSTGRAELHLRAGEALERVRHPSTDHVLPELAHHFTLAAPVAGVERGIDYNLRAAAAAVATVAYEEAAARISAALDLGIADPRERARVQLELAYLLGETGKIADAEAMLAASLDSVTGLEERGVAARALAGRMGHHVFADPEADPAETEAVARQAIETLQALDDTSGVAHARWLLATALWRQGRAAAGYAELERALVEAEAAGDAFAVRRVVTTLGGILCEGPAPVGEAIGRCEELLRSYAGNPVLEGVITRFLSLPLAMAGRFEEAREHVERSSHVLDEVQQLTQWVYRRVAAETKELLGDLAGAEHELTRRWESLRDVRGTGPDARAMQAACQLALVYCDEGRWDDAAKCLAYGSEVPEPAFFRPEAVLRLAARARLAAHRGKTADGLEFAGLAVALVEPTDWLNLKARAWLALAEVQRAGGATAEADAAVAEAIRLYEAKGNVAAAEALRTASAGFD